MIEDRYFLEPAVWSVDEQALRAVRTAVFIEEQQVPEDEEWDGDDALADHVLARSRDGEPVGTARLTPDGRIGRMAVLKPWRGMGIGAALLRHLVERARERGLQHLSLHAQLHALPLYAAAGFVAVGPEFDECGIAHRKMTLDLAPEDPSARPTAGRMAPPAGHRERLSASRAGDLRDATLAVSLGARHELRLYTRDLDPPIYEDPAIVEAFRKVALSGRRADIRILLQDPTRVVREGHRLIDLGQRLPSVVHVRVPAEEDLGYVSAFLLNDAGGFLFRPFGDRYEAEGDCYYPPRRDELARYFEEVWTRAHAPVELRRLSL